MVPVVLILLFVIFVLFCAWVEVKKIYLNRTKLKAFHQPPQYPVIGIAGRFLKNSVKSVTSVYNLFDETQQPFAAWMGPLLTIGIADPEDMQVVLNSEHCLNKAYTYSFLRNPTGLLTSTKKTWKAHRHALTPSFNTKVIKRFVPIFDDKSKILCQKLETEVGKSFDITRFLFKVSSDMLVNTQLGMNWDIQTSYGDKLHYIFKHMMESFAFRMINLLHHVDFFYSFTEKYKTEMDLYEKCFQFLHSVRETKEVQISKSLNCGEDVLAKGKEKNSLNWIERCFLSYQKGAFTEQNLVEELETIFIAGVDTSATTMTNLLLMLAMYPEVQDNVVNELHEIFDSADSEVTDEDLSRMVYTGMVIKETLRHFAIAPFLLRVCDQDVPLKGGLIPKGAVIILNMDKMHKNPKYWGEKADKFDPDHFLPEKMRNLHPYTYLPFSGGVRNCVGYKYSMNALKVMVANLLRKYEFTTHLKYEDIRINSSFTCEIENENPVQIAHREF